MSVKIMAMCFAAKFGTPTRKVLALALADHADDDGASIYPSVARLAEKCEIDRRTVQRQLRAFEEAGLLKVLSVGGMRGKDTREWAFDLGKLAELAEIRGGAVPPVARRQGRRPVQVGAAMDPGRGGTVPPKPSKNHQETSNSCGTRATVDATQDEIEGLNGATATIIENVAKWVAPAVGCKPDTATARKIVASNTRIYGADAVRRGYAMMQTDVIAGTVIGNALKAFTAYCDNAKSGRGVDKPKARDWHAEKKASRERLFAEVEEIKRKRAAAMEAAR
jgi:hypothetical protein